MAHIPVNHHLRPVYRVLAGLAGLYVLLFGVLGFVETSGGPAFDQGTASVLGLRTNLAFSIASVIAGAAILLALFVGRNVDYLVNLVGGIAFLVAGMAMMALLRTDVELPQLLDGHLRRVVCDRHGAVLGRPVRPDRHGRGGPLRGGAAPRRAADGALDCPMCRS